MSTPEVPAIFDDAEMFDWMVRNHVQADAEWIGQAMNCVGRNSAPFLLIGAWEVELLADVDALAAGLSHAWTMAEYPSAAFEPNDWRAMFREAGFIFDGKRAPRRRPRKARTLYRGAVREHARGWSWTDDVDVARWFAGRREGGLVWQAIVEPGGVLARFPEAREEAEWVVDPDTLARVEMVAA